jgi:hypothetical protein
MSPRDFDPFLVASEWHNGQWSALYSYASTGQVHGEDHKEALLSEIDSCLESNVVIGDDEDLAELELLRYTIEAWPREAV